LLHDPALFLLGNVIVDDLKQGDDVIVGEGIENFGSFFSGRDQIGFPQGS
jgi:hypothetical protein